MDQVIGNLSGRMDILLTDDPLAQMGLTAADFGWITGRLCDVAEECCAGRLVSVLEGGYDLDALADSVAAHVGVLMARGA